ncbi:MAG TPA: ZIP family metal transporter [Bdellovibrionota bacterium]|jgi:zinc and cadmium transporter
MNSLALLAALAHFLVILASGSLPLTWKLEGKFFDLFLCFGAGALLSAAFLHMLPSSIPALGPATGAFLLGGYLIMTTIERFTMAHPCGEEGCPSHRIGIVALFGLSVHSVIAGMALGVGLAGAASFSTSLALLSAILVHKVPETLALMSLLALSGWRGRAAFGMLLLFASMGPSGILIGSLMGNQSPAFLSGALAISAGTFLYIASSDLLPHLHRKMKEEWGNFLAFLVGIAALSFEAWHHLMG